MPGWACGSACSGSFCEGKAVKKLSGYLILLLISFAQISRHEAKQKLFSLAIFTPSARKLSVRNQSVASFGSIAIKARLVLSKMLQAKPSPYHCVVNSEVLFSYLIILI